MAAAKYPKITGNSTSSGVTEGVFYDLVDPNSFTYGNVAASSAGSGFSSVLVQKFTSTSQSYNEAYAVIIIRNDSLDAANNLIITDAILYDDYSLSTVQVDANSPVSLDTRELNTSDGTDLGTTPAFTQYIGIQKQSAPYTKEVNYTQTMPTDVITADGGSRAVKVRVQDSGKVTLVSGSTSAGDVTGANFGVSDSVPNGHSRLIPIYDIEFIKQNPIPGGRYAAFLIKCSPVGLSSSALFESVKHLNITHNGNSEPFKITIQNSPNNLIILSTTFLGTNIPQGTQITSSTLKFPEHVLPGASIGTYGMFSGLDYVRYRLLPEELGGTAEGTAYLEAEGLPMPAAAARSVSNTEESVLIFFNSLVAAGYGETYAEYEKDYYKTSEFYRSWFRNNTTRKDLFSGQTFELTDVSLFGEEADIAVTVGAPSNSTLIAAGINPISGTNPGDISLFTHAKGNPLGNSPQRYPSGTPYVWSFSQTKSSTLHSTGSTYVNMTQLNNGMVQNYVLADTTKYGSVQMEVADISDVSDIQTANAIVPYAMYPIYSIPAGIVANLVNNTNLYPMNMKTPVVFSSATNDNRRKIPHNNQATTFHAKSGHKTPCPQFGYSAPYNSSAESQFNFNVTVNSHQPEADVATYGLIKYGDSPSIELGTSGISLNDETMSANKMHLLAAGSEGVLKNLTQLNHNTSSSLAAFDSKSDMYATDASTTASFCINFSSDVQFREFVQPVDGFFSNTITPTEGVFAGLTFIQYPQTLLPQDVAAKNPYDASDTNEYDVSGASMHEATITIPQGTINYGNGMVPDYLFNPNTATVKLGYYNQPAALVCKGFESMKDDNGLEFGGQFNYNLVDTAGALHPRLDRINYTGTFYNWDHGTYGIAAAGNFNNATPEGATDGLFDWKLDGSFAAASTRCAQVISGDLGKVVFDITHTPQSGGYDNTDHHNDFKAGSFPSASNVITIHSDDQADTYTADLDGTSRCKISVGQRVYQITSGTPTKLLNTKQYYVKSITYSGTAGASNVVSVTLNQDSETGAATNADFRFVDTWVQPGMEIINSTLFPLSTKRYFLGVKSQGPSSDVDRTSYTIVDQDGTAVNGVEGNGIVTIKKAGVKPAAAKYGYDTSWTIEKVNPVDIINGDVVELTANSGGMGSITSGEISAMSGGATSSTAVGTKFTATASGPASKAEFKLIVDSPILPGLTDIDGNAQLAHRFDWNFLDGSGVPDMALKYYSVELTNDDISGNHYVKQFAMSFWNKGEEDVYIEKMQWKEAEYIPEGYYYNVPYTSVGAAPAKADNPTWAFHNILGSLNLNALGNNTWINQNVWNGVNNEWTENGTVPTFLPTTNLGDRRLTRIQETPKTVYGEFKVDKTDASGDYWKVLKVYYYRNAAATSHYKTEVDGSRTERPFKDKELWVTQILVHVSIDNATEISLSDSDGSLIPDGTVISFNDIEQ